MKRGCLNFALIAVIGLLLFLLYTTLTSSKKTSTPQETVVPMITAEPTVKPTDEPLTFDGFINSKAKEFTLDIDHISINDNLGTEEKGDFIALIYFKKGFVNSAKEKMTGMLSQFASDIATNTYKLFPEISEIAIFYECNNAYSGQVFNFKYTYTKKDKGMYLTDKYE